MCVLGPAHAQQDQPSLEVSGYLSHVEHHGVQDGNQTPVLGSQDCLAAE